MKVYVYPPDGTAGQAVVLQEGEAVLVGRDPDPEAEPVDPGVPAPTRCLTVASPLISSDHLLLWSRAGEFYARDLHSKNGTYLRIERGGAASLRGTNEVHLFLAAPRPNVQITAPRDVQVTDTDARVFVGRVRESIAEWLAQGGLPAALHVISDDAREPSTLPEDGRLAIPLVDGMVLEIAEQNASRTQLRLDGIKAELFPFVYKQIARWRACRVAFSRGQMAFTSSGSARALREVLDAARLRLPVVLCGETGTGKTALAAIYAGHDPQHLGSGGRASRDGRLPFVTVHCAHLDPPLAHSTLFGSIKGSYTSSERTIVGAVKLANGGVLFLDDVDALPLETQAKLLRFLDDGQYEPLGHGQREPLSASVRVVAGTNLDLRAAVRERRFREDLYWRLHMGAVVRVPPLRERPEDIEQILRDSPGDLPQSENGEEAQPRSARVAGRSVRDRLDASALDFLVHRHKWRGNFRELLRLCARVRMEVHAGALLDRRRCEEILAETALDPEAPSAAPIVEEGAGAFELALQQAVAWWIKTEGTAPQRFDELGRFCERYFKSIFVAHVLGLSESEERPESFDRQRRQQLGCDLTTLKRKIDDYLEVRKEHALSDGGGG